jgi:carotenoid cleavage dioxygenase-like enzyme
MVDFSQVPTKVGYFAPERFEGEVFDCEVQGKIPKDLRGTFFRVGGDWLYPPKFADDAPLNSDGYISAFRFHDGIVDFKGRYVRTKRFLADRNANRQLYGYYRNPYTDDPAIRDPSRPNLRTVSNTAPLIHAGKLFTLKEDGLPHRIDPATLETLGVWDFDGAWKSQTFTAHPKLDPVSGEMVAFGYEATGLATDDVFIYTVNKSGQVAHEIRVKTPYVTMLHDVALTQEHFIIPMCGYVTSLDILKQGKIHWWWDNAKPGYIGILSRRGDGKDIRWFKGPARCMMHTFNAHTIGSKVVLYAPFWDGNFFPFFPNIDGSPFDPKRARAFVRKITIDLKSKSDTYTEEILFQSPVVDLGKVDPRFMTLEQRYGFTGFADPKRPFDAARAGNIQGRVTNCYGRFDFTTGKWNAYFAGDTHSLQECSFIPRPGSRAESDGYLVGVAANYAEMRSELIIADAQNLEAGDVARVILPFRTSAQVHGIWAGAEELT